MFKRLAGFLATVMLANTISCSVYADPTTTHSVVFKDTGLSGEFSQGTACGTNGTSYGTTENKDGELYVVTSDLVTSNKITEGQYYVGAPNAIPYSTLTKSEEAYLKAYKGYRFRTEETTGTGEDTEITYNYYAFRGWLVSSTGTGQTHNGEIVKPGSQIMITADTTLTAQWGKDANRNGIADLDEGDFKVLYMPGRDEDGSAKYALEEGSLPPSYNATAEVVTPFSPYYEITGYNDPNDDEFKYGIEGISANYIPKITEEYAEANNVHKCFVGWEYDLTSVGQDESTITEAPVDENEESPIFETMVGSLYDHFYKERLEPENQEALDAAMNESSEAYNKLYIELESKYLQLARDEVSKWFETKQLVYHLQPGTKGFIPIKVWDDTERHFKYYIPSFTANTNIVLRAVWKDDINDNEIPDEEESKYTVKYLNDETGYTGSLPTDNNSYLPGEQFDVAPISGTVPGKVFMGWIDSYWDKQYNLVSNPDMEHYGYAGKYPNKFHLYVSGTDNSWAETFENRYSYKDGDTIYEVKGKSVIGDGTVPHNYQESLEGMTFPKYDEDNKLIDTTYLKNTVETGDQKGEVLLTAWWEDDKNNNNIPDIIEPHSKAKFIFTHGEYMNMKDPVGTTDMLKNVEDPATVEAYKSGKKSVTLSGVPADINTFTNDWITVPKDDPVMGTDAYIPKLDDATKSELKLIFKDWLYVSADKATIKPVTRGSIIGQPGTIKLDNIKASTNSEGTQGTSGASGEVTNPKAKATISPYDIKSQETEIQPLDSFKLSEDVYLVAVWYNDINENDKPDETEQKYTVKYTSGTTDNVTNLPPDQTDQLCLVKQTVAEAIPYREGYSFTGWKSSFDGQIYKSEQEFEMPEDNVIFEATWAKTTYVLTYLDKDGKIYTAYNYAEGQNVALLKLDDYSETATEDEKSYTYVFTFTGWQDLETGQIYSTSYAMPGKNVSLQAYYTKNKVESDKEIPKYYRVAYDPATSDTVTDIPVDVSAYSEGSVVVVSYTIPVRKDFIFKGWSDGANTYQPGNHFTIGNSDVTLTAVWEEDRNSSGNNNQSTTESTTEGITTDQTTTDQTTTDQTTETTTESDIDDNLRTTVYQDKQVENFDPEVVLGDVKTYPVNVDVIKTHGFKVTPNPIADESTKAGAAITYSKRPTVTVADEATGTVLKEGVDYAISYTYEPDAQVSIDEADTMFGWVVIKALGKYKGGVVLPFCYARKDSTRLYASNKIPVDLNDESTYPEYGGVIGTNICGIALNGVPVYQLGTYKIDDSTGVATIPGLQVWFQVPEGYGTENLKVGEKYILKDSYYDIEYKYNDGSKEVAYVIIKLKGTIGGHIVYPFKVSKGSGTDTPRGTNVTGNAVNNTKCEDINKVISFENSTLDYMVNSISLKPLYGKYFSGLFDDKTADADAKAGQARTVTVTDYFKVASSLGEIKGINDNFYSLGFYNDEILQSNTSNPTGILMSLYMNNSKNALGIGNNNTLSVDVLPVLKKSLYDGLLDNEAQIKVLYDPNPLSEYDSNRVVIGSLNLKDLDYNEITLNNEKYITPMWQTIVCDIKDIEKTSEPEITFALTIPDYLQSAPDKGCFRLGVDNLRTGITTEDTGDVEKEYTFRQPGLNISDSSTVPSDVNTKVNIEGIEVSPNPIGTVGTKEPALTIKNSTTGETLKLNVDYKVTYKFDDTHNFGLVLIEGTGNYSGLAVLPYAYKSGASIPTTESTTEQSTESTTEQTTESTTETPSTGKTSIGMTDYKIVYGNKLSYPQKINSVCKTYGFKLSKSYLGTVNTTKPTVTITDEATGKTLVSGVDYTISYDWSGSNTSTSPYFMIIEGMGKYEGYIVLPYVYSKSSSSGGGSSSSSSSGSGGGSPKRDNTEYTAYTVTFLTGNHAVARDDKNNKGYVNVEYKKSFSKLTAPVLNIDKGFYLKGWSTSTHEKDIVKNLSSLNVTSDTTLFAIYTDKKGNVVETNYKEVDKDKEETTEETTESTTNKDNSNNNNDNKNDSNVEEHKSYISGYSDGTFRPSAPISRAETCSILANVLGLSASNSGSVFYDVPSDAWYARSIEAVRNAGITSGYSDGTFKPNSSITRAEFVTLIAKAKGLSGSSCNFTDVQSSWAYTYICGVANAGYISGYNDGTFKPNEEITRAEAVVIFNKLLGRTPDTNYISASYENIFNDLESNHWSYPYIFEACRTHYYKADDYSSTHETWVSHD